MTRGEDFVKNTKCTHGHRSALTNLAWCDLNKKCTVLKLHDMCHNPKWKCQKQITFSPKQIQLEGAGFENTEKKIFRGSQTAWHNIFLASVEKNYSYFFGRCCFEDEEPPISSSND